MKHFKRTIMLMLLSLSLVLVNQNCGKTFDMLNIIDDDENAKDATLGGNPGNPIDPCCGNSGSNGSNSSLSNAIVFLGKAICYQQYKYGYILDKDNCFSTFWDDTELATFVTNSSTPISFQQIEIGLDTGEYSYDAVILGTCVNEIKSISLGFAETPVPGDYSPEIAMYLIENAKPCTEYIILNVEN